MKQPTLAFVGAGRLATALAVRFHELGYPITTIQARSSESAERLAAQVGAEVGLPTADITFIAVPDDTIQTIATQLSGTLVHTSGVHSLDIFGKHDLVGSFHPMYPFRDGTRLDGYEGMLIGIEASNDDLLAQLGALANALGGQPVHLQAGQKALYHAAAVMASNYLVTLFDTSQQMIELAGVSRQQSKTVLLNLMQGALNNLSSEQPPLTGPISRGDAQTIQKHLMALAETPWLELYTLLGKHTVPLAPDDVQERLKHLW